MAMTVIVLLMIPLIVLALGTMTRGLDMNDLSVNILLYSNSTGATNFLSDLPLHLGA